jgi:hypothetical protein
MPTKKVVRKPKTKPVSKKTYSVRYNKNENKSGVKFVTGKTKEEIAKQEFNDFKYVLDRAYDSTVGKWKKLADDGDDEERKKMMLDYIQTYGKKSNFFKNNLNKYFKDGKPNYKLFEIEVLNKGIKNVENPKSESAIGNANKGFFIKNLSDKDKEDIDLEVLTTQEAIDKFKKYYEKIPERTTIEYEKAIQKAELKRFNDLDKGSKARAAVEESIKTGSYDEKVRKLLEDPEIMLRHLERKVAIEGSKINPKSASDIYEKIYGEKIDPEHFKKASKERLKNITKEEFDQGRLLKIATVLDYKNPTVSTDKPAVKAIAGFIKNDPELNTLPIEEALKKLEGKKIKWNEVIVYNDGKSPSVGPIKKNFEKLGLHVDAPEGKGLQKKKKKKGLGALSTSSGGYSTGSSYTSGGAKYSPSSLFSRKTYSTDITGRVKEKKNKGRINKFFKKTKDKTVGKIHPSPKERVRDFEKKYEGYLDKDILEEDKMIMGKTKGPGGWIRRRLAERQATRLVTDPKYREKKIAERELDKGIRVARILRAQKEAQAKQRAATSPWYGAFYNFSKYSKWIALTALIIAILFIPMGMFHVLGWALAVAVIALFQFIIWVFMEIWFLLAQAIVAIVGLVGQVFIMVINWVGKSIAGVLGQPYEPFQHQLVQNMLMFERDATGNWVVYTYTDLSGLTKAEIDAGMGRREILTWGALNLTPPAFLNLELFKPEKFDTNTIIGHIIPPLRDFFSWMYTPIANRYTTWMTNLPPEEWYWPGVIIGVPAILIIVGIILIWRFAKRKYQMV